MKSWESSFLSRLAKNCKKYGEIENMHLTDFYFSLVVTGMMMCATCKIHVCPTPEESKMALDEE